MPLTRREYELNARLIARRGSECPAAKLDEKTVALILQRHRRKRELEKKLNDMWGVKAIAKRLGLHVRTVERIIQRGGWIHVREEAK